MSSYSSSARLSFFTSKMIGLAIMVLKLGALEVGP